MQNSGQNSLKGHFLMAMPGMVDPNFVQTVTCICEHTPDGAVGVVINRVHPHLSIKNLFDELEMEFTIPAVTIPIHIGGPVHLGEVFLLHGPPFEWQGCLKITPSLAMSNTKDILSAVALGQGPEAFLVSLGCAGWGPGQLESELMQNAWLTGPATENVIFEVPVEYRWEEAVKQIGIDPSLLSTTAGHA